MMLTKTQKICKKMLEDNFIGEDSYDAALVVMSACHVGASTKKVSKDTGLSMAAIAPYRDNLKKSGVWRRDGKISIEKCETDEDWAVEILLLVNVAMGYVQRSRG